MASKVEELTVNYSDGATQTVKELGKEILSKGAWATVIFKYREWDPKKQDFGPERYTIRRYQKRNGQYLQKSKFNISSLEQAKSLIGVLQRWLDESADG